MAPFYLKYALLSYARFILVNYFQHSIDCWPKMQLRTRYRVQSSGYHDEIVFFFEMIRQQLFCKLVFYFFWYRLNVKLKWLMFCSSDAIFFHFVRTLTKFATQILNSQTETSEILVNFLFSFSCLWFTQNFFLVKI